MGSLRTVDLGTVTHLSLRETRTLGLEESVGVPGTFPQNLEAEITRGTLRGFLANPAQAAREAVAALHDGEVGLLDLNAEEGLYRWAKVGEVEFKLSEYRAGIWDYAMPLYFVPCIGYTRALTAEMGFSDLAYHRCVRELNPFTGYNNITLGSNGLTHQFELYVTNLKSSEQTVEFEIYAGDDLSKVEIWAWDEGEWAAVGDWCASGCTDVFGGTEAYTDEDDDAHTFRVDHDVRGATVSNFTADVSYSLGNDRRAMVQITGLDAYVAASALSTKVGDFQLLLKIKLTHTNRETARSYPIVTYKDGGFGLGPA